jgi:hypothetical protein
MNDLYDLLCWAQTLCHFRTSSPLFYSINKIFHYSNIDIGLKQGTANLTRHFFDIISTQLSA